MFRNSYQGKYITILSGGGGLETFSMWDKCIQDGYIKRFVDLELKTLVYEIGGTNVSTTYMKCPRGKQELGISLPFLILVVKNLHKYFSFEVTIRDTGGQKRRFRAANFQCSTQIMPSFTAMPIGLEGGWNQIQFNLADFTQRAYRQGFYEAISVQMNANIRIKRIYFSDKLYSDDELPKEYKLFHPLSSGKGAKKENITKDKRFSTRPSIRPSTRVPSAPVSSQTRVTSRDSSKQPQEEVPPQEEGQTQEVMPPQEEGQTQEVMPPQEEGQTQEVMPPQEEGQTPEVIPPQEVVPPQEEGQPQAGGEPQEVVQPQEGGEPQEEAKSQEGGPPQQQPGETATEGQEQTAEN